jgi:hypothetical protein
MILGATVQKLWVFEVFGQDLGKAGMCSNQQELTICTKSGGQEIFYFILKMGRLALSRCQLAAMGDRLLPAGRGSTPG